MRRSILLLALAFFLNQLDINAQITEGKVWNGKKCAVSLTYDDGLNEHLDNAIPALDSHGFKGTFYAQGSAPALNNRLPEWRGASESGHELGNHTLFHPCAASPPGRDWVNPDYDLDKYSLTRMTDEISLANAFLKSIDGKSERSFAYTCGEKSIGDKDFSGLIHKDFVAARTVVSRMEMIDNLGIYDIGSYMINGQKGEDLIALVKEALDRGALLVFLFHGVGGGHGLNVSLPAHKELLDFLKANEADIWVAPMVEVGKYVQSYRSVDEGN